MKSTGPTQEPRLHETCPIPFSPCSSSPRHAAAVPGADAYRKHFAATAHLCFLVWHGLSASPSLRQSHAMAAADPTFDPTF